jgi:enoyl-CoA hydratase/carnithine racemase
VRVKYNSVGFELTALFGAITKRLQQRKGVLSQYFLLGMLILRTAALCSIVYSERILFRAKDGESNNVKRRGISMSTGNIAHQHDEGAVRLEQNGPVAVITLSRPAALNALTWSMYQQMETHLKALDADESAHAIIIRGEGKAFAAGTDIQQFQGFTGEDGVAYERTMQAIVERLYTITKPTIAAIHGYAVGAGLAIATVCDLRYATPASRFGVPIARTLGNCISLKNYQHLVNAFGAMRAKEMLLTGRLLTAADALQCGFLTALADEEKLMAHVTEVAQQISTLAPLTLWSVKEAQRRLYVAAAAVHYDDVVARVYGSDDFAEGVQAYLEKRKPQWRGQ